MINSRNKKKLIIRFLNGEMSLPERRELEMWINLNDENLQYFHMVKALYDATHKELNKIANTDAEWKRLNERIRKEKKKARKKRLLVTYRNIAAVLLIPLIVAGALYLTGTSKATKVTFNNKITALTPKGEKSKLILPDNTVVWLNSGSKLSYSNFGNNGLRKVELEGEAFFDVAKDKQHPFIVITKDYDVKVLGTKFNVRSYSNENTSETVLEEGSVEITLQSGEKYMLSPGQMAVAGEKTALNISNVSVINKICWKNNILKLNNTPVKDMVPMLERWYGVHIDVTDMSRVADKRFTMTIKTESLQEVLQLMKYVTPIKYSVNGDNVKIEFLDV
jgi:ferric-dicitrate binding protein FerR (iron transport regulator)